MTENQELNAELIAQDNPYKYARQNLDALRSTYKVNRAMVFQAATTAERMKFYGATEAPVAWGAGRLGVGKNVGNKTQDPRRTASFGITGDVVEGTEFNMNLNGVPKSFTASERMSGEQAIREWIAGDLDSPENKFIFLTGQSKVDIVPNSVVTVGDTVSTPPPLPPADQVLSRFSNLSTLEEDAVRTYVDAEVAVGNWGKYDEFWCYSLSGNNALIGFIDKTATNIGNTPIDVNGASFNGVDQYFRTHWTPTLDANNWTKDDAQLTCYLKSSIRTSNNFDYPFGANFNYVEIFNNVWSARMNSNGAKSFTGGTFDDVVVGVWRDGAPEINLVRDGVSESRSDALATNLTNIEFFVGANSNQGNLNNPINGVISTFYIGATLQSQTAHNTNVRTLLTTLGAI